MENKQEITAEMRLFLIDLLEMPLPESSSGASLAQREFRRNQDIKNKIRDKLGITSKINGGMVFYYNSDGTPYKGY